MGVNVKKIAIIGACFLFLSFSIWLGMRYWRYLEGANHREGVGLIKSGNYINALDKLEPIAHKGDAVAKVLIGTLYALGLGVSYDEVQASIWFHRMQCDPDILGKAEYGIAYEYFTGATGKMNTTRAISWLKRAAEVGNKEAQIMLANEDELLRYNLNVDKDTIEYWKNFVLKERQIMRNR